MRDVNYFDKDLMLEQVIYERTKLIHGFAQPQLLGRWQHSCITQGNDRSWGEHMENSFYETRPYLFLIIALYAFLNANEFIGYPCGALLAAVSTYIIRARYQYRVVNTK